VQAVRIRERIPDQESQKVLGKATDANLSGTSGWSVMAKQEREKRVRLTCKCGMQYVLNTVNDLRRRCTNEPCRATMHMSPEEIWEYHACLRALIKALALEYDYQRELKIAHNLSVMFESPYTIDIVEIP